MRLLLIALLAGAAFAEECHTPGQRRQITIRFNNKWSPFGSASFGRCSAVVRGKVGFNYSRDVTLNSSNRYRKKWSKEFGVFMPFAVGPIQWKRGAYIHEELSPSSQSGSAGCINVRGAGNAKRLYDYVSARTRVRIYYKW